MKGILIELKLLFRRNQVSQQYDHQNSKWLRRVKNLQNSSYNSQIIKHILTFNIACLKGFSIGPKIKLGKIGSVLMVCLLIGSHLISHYLRYRSEAVSINDSIAAFSTLSCGVPQGSVLGPLIFTLYTTPLMQ